MIFARKINKILEFYTIFARKMPGFYIVDRHLLARFRRQSLFQKSVFQTNDLYCTTL